MGHRQLTYQGPQIKKWVFFPSSHSLRVPPQLGALLWESLFKAGNLTSLMLCMSYAGSFGCSELMCIRAMSCPEDRLSELALQSFSSYILYAHSLRCALSMSWGEVGIAGPSTAELIVTQRAGICKTEDRPHWILNILPSWPLMPCLLPELWGNVYCVDLLPWGVLFWLPEPVKTGVYNWYVRMDWSDGPWAFPARNVWMRGPSGSFLGKSWC